MIATTYFLLVALLFSLSIHPSVVDGFSIVPKPLSRTTITTQLFGSESGVLKDFQLDDFSNDSQQEQQLQQPVGPVRAPLKLLGPYIGLGLTFPNLATSSQRARNISGIALDFVLDTAANINTLNAQVAQELNLEVVDEAPAGVSASGPIAGGATYLLGDCELEGLPEEDQFTFMENLTASTLPVASPAAAGLLSMPFFHCFEGGVEFDWFGQQQGENDEKLPPSITFYGSTEESSHLIKEMKGVPIKELPVTRLPTVKLNINGVEIPALFDTGSPITVLNSQAAEQAGVKTTTIDSNNGKTNSNLLAGLVNKVQQAQAMAQAAARGDVLTIAGSTGERINLIKSESPVQVSLSPSDGYSEVSFGERSIYVGNIPGLAALNGLGDDSPPAAVLGMDVLRSKPKMLLIASNHEVYF
ncbi:aspartyl protease [Nitzschia inconspicua]|uniref:Aspartyl protease n=1 Tax=Nitzschia inconspicua TaxID=303405 RepID=A0A9K3Q3L5_9STRA|nr:aspartyl protease [Nitzschia inconspicua]